MALTSPTKNRNFELIKLQSGILTDAAFFKEKNLPGCAGFFLTTCYIWGGMIICKVCITFAITNDLYHKYTAKMPLVVSENEDKCINVP